MALELQIGVGSANANLARAEAAIGSLMAQLDRFNASTTGLDAVINRLNAIRVPPQAADALRQLATSVNQLGALRNIESTIRGLERIATMNFSQVAQGVASLSGALRGLVVPSGFAAVATMIMQISSASANATAQVRNLATTLGQVNATNLAGVQVGLNGIAGHAGTAGANVRQASVAMQGFQRAGEGAITMMRAFGVATGAVAVASFVKQGYEMVVVQNQLVNAINAVTNSTTQGASAWAYVKGLASATASDIETLTKSYRGFVVALAASNVPMDQAQAMFGKITVAARVFGLTNSQLEGTLYAVQQMVSKGAVTMEELRRQLGDRLPGAFAHMATAMGVTIPQLHKMVESGQLSAKNVGLLADQLYKAATQGGGLAAALKTPQAMMTLLGNSAKLTSMAFTEALFNGIMPFIDGVMGGAGSLQSFASIAGAAVGALAGMFLSGLGVIGNGFSYLATMVNFGAANLKAFGIIAAGILGIALVPWIGYATVATIGLAASFARATTALVVKAGVISLGVIPALAGYVAAAGLATLAGLRWLMSLGPIGLGLAAVSTAAIIAAGKSIDWTAATDKVSKVASDAGKVVLDLGNKIGSLSGTFGDVTQDAKNTANGLNGVKTGADNAGNGVGSLGGRLGGLRGQLSSTSAAAQKLAQDFFSLKAAAQEAALWSSNAISSNDLNYMLSGPSLGNSGQGYTDVGGGMYQGYQDVGPGMMSGSYRKGGIVGAPRERVSVPVSAFINAPHFATGGLSDGGIPSILHPGEAVVPLEGGAIPVDLGDNSNATSAQLLQMIAGGVNTLNQSTLMVRQGVLDVGVLVANKMDKLYMVLVDIDNGLDTLPGQMGDAVSTGSSASGSYNYGLPSGTMSVQQQSALLAQGIDPGGYISLTALASGGAGSGRNTNSSAGSTQLEELINSDPKVRQWWVSMQGKNSRGGGIAPGYAASAGAYGGGFLKFGGFSANNSETIGNEFDEWEQGFGDFAAGPATYRADPYKGSPAYYYDPNNAGATPYDPQASQQSDQEYYAGYNMPTYAKGSPNVFKDAMGMGVVVGVHEDEAIIPLDGGAVPVDITGLDVFKQLASKIVEGDPMSAGAATGGSARVQETVININVDFQVVAKDPEQFKASGDQVLQDFAAKLERTLKTVGKKMTVDDPTQRP